MSGDLALSDRDRDGWVLHDALDLALAEDGAAVTAAESRSRSGELRAVVGHVEDIIAGLGGGLNAPVPAGPGGR